MCIYGKLFEGDKMSKLWSKIILGLVTAFVIGISNANAELTCVAQPSCAMLGYSKTNVPNCTGYIHCPFDTSYKKCVTLDHTEAHIVAAAVVLTSLLHIEHAAAVFFPKIGNKSEITMP